MKSILISVRPEHAVNILNGDKIRELRKCIPKDIDEIIKEQGGIWVYMYVTKGKPYLHRPIHCEHGERKYSYEMSNKIEDKRYLLNGFIVARWWFDGYALIEVDSEQHRAILKDACLTLDDVIEYCKGKDLYAWHISKLEIFDKPMQLSEFGLKRPMQSWGYVYVETN